MLGKNFIGARVVICAFSFSFANVVCASHEKLVAPLYVNFKFKDEDRLEITIKVDESGSLKSLQIVLNDKLYSVPEKELDGCGSQFQIAKSKVFVTVAAPGEENDNKSFKNFVLSIPFGELTVNFNKDQESFAFDQIRFEFKDGVLEQRRSAISLGDDREQWKLLTKVVGQPEQGEGIVKDSKNPFDDAD